MQTIKFNSNQRYYIKASSYLLAGTLILTISMYMQITGAMSMPLFITILGVISIIFIALGWYLVIKNFLKSNKGMVFDDMGIEYLGKRIINWNEIDYIRFRSQVDLKENNTTTLILDDGKTTSAAIGNISVKIGPMGDSLGLESLNQIENNILLGIAPKDPKSYLGKRSWFYQKMMKLNQTMECNDNEVLFLNIAPFLDESPKNIAKALLERNVNVIINSENIQPIT